MAAAKKRRRKDPVADKVFPVTVLTRRHIADDLNERIADAKEEVRELGDEADAETRRIAKIPRFTATDARLTDARCQSLADQYADLEIDLDLPDSDDGYGEGVEELKYKFLLKLGRAQAGKARR